MLAPSDDEEAWLRHLVKIGHDAEAELKRREAFLRLSWNTLWDEFLLRSSGSITPEGEESYGRWMRILADAARQLKLSSSDLLDTAACNRICAFLAGKYVSAKRMIVFFRRVYKTLGLDPTLWNTGFCGRNRNGNPESEFYRRLSLEEVRKVHRNVGITSPDLADMIMIGYSTGLRMSDVSELHTGEIGPQCGYLNIVPNKTRKKKPRPIRIPLTEQARKTVMRRCMSPDADGYLFPKESRKRPSRKIANAFRNCGVLQVSGGRASFHSLRATFISLMDEAGIPPHVTDAITGHAGGGMHARYTQPSAQALLEAVNKAIPPL